MRHFQGIDVRLASPWLPRLSEQAASPSDRLVTALAEDILDGKLQTGARLPAHRNLADHLNIAVGTVTKAYGMLERRGLVRSVHGAGTFVAHVQARTGPLIDLSRNAPPAVMTERLLARTLTAIAKRIDSGMFNDYPPIGGHHEHRVLMANWFSSLGMQVDPVRLVLTSGAHHAVSVALSVTCGSHGTLFTETHTYPGVIALAAHQGVTLTGVSMDAEGMMPNDLDKRLSSRKRGRAAVYLTPTMQNPTTATMGRVRREDIVAVCRAHDVYIIEDDVYTLCPDSERPPLALLAPERTLYANSMSKTLNPTLRIGGLVVPESIYPQAVAALQASAIMVSPLSCAVMEQWLLDGTAKAVAQAIQQESARRARLARTILGDRIHAPGSIGYHLWLPLPPDEARRLEDAAKAAGVLVTPVASTSADPKSETSGIRLCLGAVHRSDLEVALEAIRRLQDGGQSSLASIAQS